MSKIEKALEKAKRMRERPGEEDPRDYAYETPFLFEKKMVYSCTKKITVDKAHLEKNRLMALIDDPQAMDSYNLLRTQILEKTRLQGHNTIMITSALEGEGKTTTAINLAASIAREEKQTVLLVDADLRNPKVRSFLGCETERGLSDYLQKNVPVDDLLINPGLPNMVVLPGGSRVSNSTDIIGSSKMLNLVKEMKHRYPDRYVIFDCPPVLLTPDALIFSSYVAGVIFVVQSGRTSKNQIRKALGLLEDKNIIGLIMNRGETQRSSYYYY